MARAASRSWPMSRSRTARSRRSASSLARGHEEIDAQGKIVTPGFVDIHTHYDGQATWDGRMQPSSWHGVTTVVMGNCGVGFAPCRDEDHDKLVRLMEGVEDIPFPVLTQGLPWNWNSYPDYLDALARTDVRRRHRQPAAPRGACASSSWASAARIASPRRRTDIARDAAASPRKRWRPAPSASEPRGRSTIAPARASRSPP